MKNEVKNLVIFKLQNKNFWKIIQSFTEYIFHCNKKLIINEKFMIMNYLKQCEKYVNSFVFNFKK